MVERRSILRPDGTLVAGTRPRMDEEFVLEALRLMMLSRAYDERVIGLQRQGRFGVFSTGLGQEAKPVHLFRRQLAGKAGQGRARSLTDQRNAVVQTLHQGGQCPKGALTHTA